MHRAIHGNVNQRSQELKTTHARYRTEDSLVEYSTVTEMDALRFRSWDSS